MKFLREPLVQFLLLGGALFGIFSLVGQLNFEKPGQVVVSAARIDALCKGFQIDFGHWPNPDETSKLIADWVREEILVREAEKIQFQHENQNIRRLMQQHMESSNEGTVQLPTDAQLQEFLSAHPEVFRQNPAAPVPNLEQIKPAVQNVWMAAQRKLARDSAYEKIKARYHVEVENPNLTTNPASGPAR